MQKGKIPARNNLQQKTTQTLSKEIPKEEKNKLKMEESQRNEQEGETQTNVDQIQNEIPTTDQFQLELQSERKLKIFVSFFELLGKNAFDLLADKNPISILEDKFGAIQLLGITERQVSKSQK